MLLRNILAPQVVAPAPDEKKLSANPASSRLGKACWGMSCLFLTFGVAGLAVGSVVSAVDCSFTPGVANKNSDDCYRGFVLLGLSLLAMTAASCSIAVTNKIKRDDIRRAAMLQKLPKVSAVPATVFAKPAEQTDSVLKEIKVDSVEVANSRASQEPALKEIESRVPGLAAQFG